MIKLLEKLHKTLLHKKSARKLLVKSHLKVQSTLLLELRLEDELRHGPEHLLHVDVLLGRRFEELDAHLEILKYVVSG